MEPRTASVRRRSRDCFVKFFLRVAGVLLGIALNRLLLIVLGVGGFVVNDQRQILVIQEKNGPVQKIWKLPGVRSGLSCLVDGISHNKFLL